MRSVGYDSVSMVLEIEFHDYSAVYQYSGVPPEVYKGLMDAPSHGTYLARHIKGVFPYQRIR